MLAVDIPGIFLQETMDDNIQFKFKGSLVDMLVNIDPNNMDHVYVYIAARNIYMLEL